MKKTKLFISLCLATATLSWGVAPSYAVPPSSAKPQHHGETQSPSQEAEDASKIQSAHQRHKMPHDDRKAAAVHLKAKYDADRAQKMADEVNQHAQNGGGQ